MEQRHNAEQSMNIHNIQGKCGTHNQHISRNANAHLTNPWHHISNTPATHHDMADAWILIYNTQIR
eukprot:1169145-Prorocentrum_lima.AAC.1